MGAHDHDRVSFLLGGARLPNGPVPYNERRKRASHSACTCLAGSRSLQEHEQSAEIAAVVVVVVVIVVLVVY